MAGRILIADDLATNRIVLKVKLSAASYDVVQADKGSDLLAMVAQKRPDLVIIDGAFQGDRAIDLCHEISNAPTGASVPVMIISSDFTGAERLAALNAGAFDVLRKPLDNATLLARVRNILRVKSVEQELMRRQHTAVELGFHDSASPFQYPAQILVIDGADQASHAWQDALKHTRQCNFHYVGHSAVLEAIGRNQLVPDMIVLPAQFEDNTQALFLLAEFRSRPETRHAAIVVTNMDGNCEAAINALDMGASDVVEAGTSAAEFAFRMARQLQRKLESDRLRATLEDGLRLAVTDSLTGLFNRRYALPHLARVGETSAATGRPFAVMVLDLDRFKRINDTFGHAAGDEVLREIAMRLKLNLRNVDLVARIGGEEFLVVMPDTDLKEASTAAERLRRAIQDQPIHLAENADTVQVTASIGVSIGGKSGETEQAVENMMARADQALMGAKATGRNQVTIENRAAA